MSAQSDHAAAADEAPQHSGDFIAAGVEVMEVLRGERAFSAEQAEAGEGFGN
jgi:hypothetical protein